MSDDRRDVLLREMRDAATSATTFAGVKTDAEFLADDLLQNAIAMPMIRLGEAATKILQDHADFAAGHPEVRWESMRGLRNLIAHAYHEIDFVILWKIMADYLPALVAWLDGQLEARGH